ncbi:LysR family transcriptional regulator [Oceaniglobus indicus]|uniref:LysR family transcriptional regulator n=1 Tax=Oceaniglobus indicus TaxID=2047749 RepID=UPI00130450B4|nr:LysR family transcriptional regulator [Oceaniglobus indicus]
MNWDDLKLFLQVAQSGQLSDAARILALDSATLSRRIRRLERAVNVALFVKSSRGYVLTEAGRALVPRVSAMAREVAQGAEMLAPATPALSGRIRIGAPDGVATSILPRVIASLTRDHPALTFEIVSLPRMADLGRREADLAITIAPPRGSGLKVSRICDYELCLAASRDYLQRHPPILTRRALVRHASVGYLRDMIFDPGLDFQEGSGLAPPGTASNSALVQFAMVRAGMGIGLVHAFLLDQAPDVMRLAVPDTSLTRTYHLVRHPDMHGPSIEHIDALLRDGISREIDAKSGPRIEDP